MNAEQFILNRYPGNSDIIKEHIRKAVLQLESGQTVGERATPVVSFWMMRDKWVKRGSAWEQIGTDGDVRFDANGMMVYPDILRLAYFITTDGLVCQLAYRIGKTHSLEAFDRARLTNYKSLENNEVEIKKVDFGVNNSTSQAANDIISAMGKIYG